MTMALRQKMRGEPVELKGSENPTGDARLKGDELGTYPRSVDTFNNRFNRAYRNLRVTHVIIGGLLAMNLVQAATIMQMLPLYKVVPLAVTFSDKEEQVVRVQPMADNIASVSILIEQQVRQYVKERNTISQDDVINLTRWQQTIKQMSTDDVFDGFVSETKPILASAKNGKFTRTVTIDTAQRVDPGGQRSGSVWRVDFTAYDRTIGQGLADTQENRRSFTVEMRVKLRPRNVTYGDRFVNPLGFTVESYSVAPRRTGSAQN
jgi:type IV secretory pathway component VirB8